MPTPFPRLFEPLHRGRLHLKNRVVFPGHQTLMSHDGVVGDRMLGYYAERAKGGVGAVVVEGAAVHPTTVKFTDYLLAYAPEIVPSLDRLTEVLSGFDCRTILQLAHSGSRMSTFDSRRELWAPSDVQSAISPEIPHEMTLDEIGELIEGYRAAATNVARSGIDGVEIHAAHEYLLGEFLSPFNNRRSDRYGGSLANRARLLLEVVDAVRAELGDDRVVGVRINGSDLTEDGVDIDEYVEVARLVADTGAIDYLSVTAGTSRDNNRIVPTMEWAQGLYVHYASAVRAAVDVPVIAVGRIKRPEHAEEILAAGDADVIAEARALIADPEWVTKASSESDRATIRPCIGCNQGCFGFLYGNHPISCTVNPAVGLEGRLGIGTAPRRSSRRVLVAGGGPSGLEAAVTAAQLGHQVVLCDAGAQLGGQILAASAIPTRHELREIVDHLVRELDRLGVEVRLGTTVDESVVRDVQPDEVVVATGSEPRTDALGSDGSVPVLAPADAMSIPEHALPSGHVVVVDRVGHFPAYAPAERLVDVGRTVTVVASALAPGGNLDHSSLLSTLRRLSAKGVRFVTSSAARSVTDGAVDVVDTLSGAEHRVDAAAVVAAVGNRANDGLCRSLRARGSLVHLVGDALAPRSMLHAIRDGRLAARRVGGEVD